MAKIARHNHGQGATAPRDTATHLGECCDQRGFERSQLYASCLPSKSESCFNTHTHRHGNTPSRPERCTYCCCRAFDRTCLLIQNKAMHENQDKNHRSGDFSDQYRSTAAFSDGTVTSKRASSIFSVESPQSCFRGSTGLSHWRNKTLIFPSCVFSLPRFVFRAEGKKLLQDALMLNVVNWVWECIFITLYRWERLWTHLTLAPTLASCSKCLHILSIYLLNGDGIASTGERRGHGSAVGAPGESKDKALCASV